MKRRCCFKKNLRNPNETMSYYFNWNLYLCIISVWFGSSSVSDILLRHLHHTGIENRFAHRLPTLVLSVDCSCGSEWLVPVGFLSDSKFLHTPNQHMIPSLISNYTHLLYKFFFFWKNLLYNLEQDNHFLQDI